MEKEQELTKKPPVLVVETNSDITDLFKKVIEHSDSETSAIILNSPEELEEHLAKRGPVPCKVITSLGQNSETAEKVAETLEKYGLEKTPVTIITGAPNTPNIKPLLSTLFPNLQEILFKSDDIDIEKLSKLFSSE